MSTYQTIIFHLKSGLSAREISKLRIAGRHKISEVYQVAKKRGWLESSTIIPSETELKVFFEKQKKDSPVTALTPHKEMVSEWAKLGNQASTIYVRLKRNFEYTGSYYSVQRFVKSVKADNVLPDLTTPLHFDPGEAAQVDFGHGPKLLDQRTGKIEQTYYFVMTLCYSRHQYAELVTHQDIETWLNCHQKAFLFFGGFPRKIIIDNPKCAVTIAGYYEAELNKSYEAYAKEMGFVIAPCPPRDPQKKGRVESGIKYVKKSFQPLRDFKHVQDANKQLKDWVMSDAGVRIHGSTYKKPLDLFEEEELKSLPKTMPDIAIYSKVRGSRNCHVRFEKCNYSIPFKFYDKDLWLKKTQTSIKIYFEGDLIAHHSRLFLPGSYATDQHHLEPKAKEYFKKTPEWCQIEAERIGVRTQRVVETFLTNPVQELLRAAQGIIKLEGKYGQKRLEKACARAIHFNSVSYKSIRDILKKGIEDDYLPEPMSQTIADVYQGLGIYQRTDTIDLNKIQAFGHA
ncbi:MAG: IS21 family transposase [Alphaproteobacteria bacterium]|nr:IS21 family transposase [Alphaproteobacteria bacterium]